MNAGEVVKDDKTYFSFTTKVLHRSVVRHSLCKPYESVET